MFGKTVKYCQVFIYESFGDEKINEAGFGDKGIPKFNG